MPVDPHLLLGFLALSAVISVVPGPSVLFATSRAIAHGRAVGLWTVAGNSLGGYVLVVAVACGLGTLVAASTTVFTVVKLLGAAYLVWLGARTLLAARASHESTPEVARHRLRGGSAARVREGFVVGVSNPKTTVFLVAVLPQFVDPDRGPVVAQMLLIGLAGAVVQLVSDGAWALGAGQLRTWFARRPSRRTALEATGGLTMLGLGVTVALGRRPAV
ncbi:LysE family translocator [Nocardioides sp. GXQ0305]|uniref:LysE family translocator n=1 Tax=Nocardioides sp. GXQ0305 TaxID=3423912 RepID=UPI003D7F0AB8